MDRKMVIPAELPRYGITIGDRQRRRLESLGEFPKRIPLTGRSHAYSEGEISAFIEGKIAARDGAEAA